MSNFYYGHILERDKARPTPSDEMVARTCIVCGLPFLGTRTAKMCGKVCKTLRARMWRERWVKKHG